MDWLHPLGVVCVKDLNRVHYRVDLLCILIAQVKTEMLLHGQHKLHSIQAVKTEFIEWGCPC